MSFDEVWPQLSALRTAEAPAAASAWKVMYAWRPQPLLLPADDAARARAALGFFVRSRGWRAWGRLLLLLDRWMPDAGLLPEVRPDHFPAAALFGVPGYRATALYCGSPGPLQKLTILGSGADGDDALVAKVALHPSADNAVAREAHWLRALAAAPATAAFMPRFVNEGVLPGGRRFVVTGALMHAAAGLRFERRHLDFLAVLAEKGRSERWTVAPALMRLRDRLRTVRGVLNDSHLRLLEAALEEIERSLGGQPLPACMLHGDFAPWNVRLRADRLFVFDWEYAQTHGNPLQDYLHFHLMPRVLQARRWMVGPGFMRCLLTCAAGYANEVFGEESGIADAAGALAVHYLLDTVTFYVEASGYMDARHTVMRAYLQLLENRRHWAQLAAGALTAERVGYGR